MSDVVDRYRGGVVERRLWSDLLDRGDRRARARLVELHLPLARRLARRYAGIAEPYDDLLQVASLGLVKAIDRFDPDRGIPFAGYATPTILGELKRHFRDKVWTVRVPRSLHDRIAKVERATEKLTRDLQRPPSVDEVAEEIGLGGSEVLEVLEARENRRPRSLDAPVVGADPDAPGGVERIGDGDGNFELVEDRLVVEAVLPVLDDTEREVLRLRFVEDLPQGEIAVRIGRSQMHVSRLLRRTLEKLREESGG